MSQINEDLTGHLSMASNEKKIETLNACGEFCASGLIVKIGVSFPAQLPTVLQTLRPNSVSHVSSTGRCCL